MEKFLSWYANHWFLSFLLLGFIIGFITQATGVNSGFSTFFGQLILHTIIVQIIGYNIGDKCLSMEKDYFQKKINMINAQTTNSK